MKRKYQISALMPTNKEANKLIASLDLGIDGVYFQGNYVATVSFCDEVTPEELEKTRHGIQQAYEEFGAKSVFVIELPWKEGDTHEDQQPT
jgi:hypothetical protein